jgi:two-component system NtrC family sensor kinase
MKIGRKFAIWIVLCAIVIAFISSLIHYKIATKEAISEFEHDGKEIARVVEISLTDVMLFGMDSSILEGTLKSLVKTASIKGMWITNDQGVARVGVPEGVVSTRRPMDWKKEQGYYLAKGNIFHWVQPIRNRQPCHRCHGSENEFNGAIMIDFSTAELHEQVQDSITEGFTMAVGTVGVIALLILGLSRSMVTKRLEKVIEHIGRVRDGKYDSSVQVKGNDEISQLSSFFNEMVEAVKARDKEKDLLFKQITKSYEMWQSTFDSITDMIAIIDDQHNIVMGNKAFLEYFGLSREDLTRKKCYEIFHDIAAPHELCPHPRAMREKSPETLEFRQPGTDRILHAYMYPYHIPELDFKGTVHVVRDVTEEKENEMRLIMSERLAALGEMASGLAHEINNPLASIAGCAEGLMNRVKKGEFDPEFFKEYLGIMAEEILRCKNITTNMLSFVRRSAVKKEMDISTVIDRTVDIIGFQGRLKNMDVVRDYDEGVPPVLVNESELRQAFMAVVTNALDAMNDKGTLTIRTLSEKGRVVVEIVDTGSGIPNNFIDRIFDPFFTTKVESGGTGLGLSIAQKIIAANDGSISATAEEGKGTTIKITLPASSSE